MCHVTQQPAKRQHRHNRPRAQPGSELRAELGLSGDVAFASFEADCGSLDGAEMGDVQYRYYSQCKGVRMRGLIMVHLFDKWWLVRKSKLSYTKTVWSVVSTQISIDNTHEAQVFATTLSLAVGGRNAAAEEAALTEMVNTYPERNNGKRIKFNTSLRKRAEEAEARADALSRENEAMKLQLAQFLAPTPAVGG